MAQVVAPFSRATCLTPQAGTQPWFLLQGIFPPTQGLNPVSCIAGRFFMQSGSRHNLGQLPFKYKGVEGQGGARSRPRSHGS